MELITRLAHALASRGRRLLLTVRGVRFNGTAWLRAIEVPRQHRAIRIGAGAGLDRGVVLLAAGPPATSPKILIGDGCYINRYTIIDASELVEVGAETMIGPHCYITDHDHEMPAGAAPGTGGLVARPTRIGARCWIGANVSILKGVTVGDGCIVGAGSVVTRSLDPGMVAAGNPARLLREIKA